MFKQIICINWGTKYGFTYINRLYAMVERNITPPFRFVCFTDRNNGIRPEVECHPLPPTPVEIPITQKGIWGKSRLWSTRLADLAGPVLFLDLDIVITGNLDELFSYGHSDDVILARNPVKPLERLGQTSVFRFPVGKLAPLQEMFSKNPVDISKEFIYEQRFVTRHAPGGIKFFPGRWIQHFRLQCMRRFPINLFLQPKLRSRTKIVIFPGGMHPEHGIRGGWKGREGINVTEHLLGYQRLKLDNESFLSYLPHYTLPTQWIIEAWRE